MSTLAQDIGLTEEEGRAIAQAACDAAEAGDLEGAQKLFEALLTLNPEDTASQAALGTVYQKLEKWAEADAAYTVAIERNGHPFALVNRGELRLKRSDQRGLEDLRRAVEADPKLKRVPAIRANALLKLRAGTAPVAAKPTVARKSAR